MNIIEYKVSMKKKNICKMIIAFFAIVTFGVCIIIYLLPFWMDVSIPFKVKDYRITITKGTVTLNEYTGSDTEIVVPERIFFLPVTYLGPRCYENVKHTITSISLPDTMTIVGMSAFWECDKLESVHASNINIIGAKAFGYDTNLRNVDLGDGIKIVDFAAFVDCSSLEKITLANESEIGLNAFYHAGIKEIDNIQTATRIGLGAFCFTPWEESQDVDYLMVGDKLIMYKGDSDIVVVPEGVKTISSAFGGTFMGESKYDKELSEIYISDTVTKIEWGSFMGQHSPIVYVPASVTNIEEGAFSSYATPLIITTSGSTAEQYAIDNGINYEIVDSWEVPET